ncbi:MAG: hypothetical protein ABFS05_00325 [Bacteroidota bacterium]
MIRTINLKWVFLTLILVMVLPSCQKEEQNSSELSTQQAQLKQSAGECDVVTDLLAGQFTDVGAVSVTHDEMNIYVTYHILEAGWCLSETHMHVAPNLAGIPQTKSGNPKVGHFEYQMQHDCITEYTYAVPIIWEEGATVVIAAHAVVDGDFGEETAWGDGAPFPGNQWATYFSYHICGEGGGGLGSESEVAYAYAPEGSQIASQCFLTMNIANEWGWHLGAFSEDYSFELWALPNTCDFTNGFHVGYVNVEFVGGNKVDVSYHTFPGYSLHEAHLWVSTEPWVAPPMVNHEDFPYHAYDLGGVMVYSFKNIMHRGPMFMIAHARVYGVIHVG